jgi:hypothetical protein
MGVIPKFAERLLKGFTTTFTRPTAHRFAVLLFAGILTTGQRTVANVLRTVATLAPGHASSYHRVFSRCRWRGWRLARTLAGLVIDQWFPTGVIALVGDDTVDRHSGDHVYGKACYRDAVRSTHATLAYCWGHKWVVLAVLVHFPFARRPWALPVLVALYRSPEFNRQQGRRHKTPAQIMQQLLAVFFRWFPERKLCFVGDGGFGTHELARFAHRHRRRLTLISRFYSNASVFTASPVRRAGQNGRPRVRGRQLPKPAEVVNRSKRMKQLAVSWYGGRTRQLSVVTAAAHWYCRRAGVVPVRWLFVRDHNGRRRDEYFFTTDPAMTPKEIIEAFTGRWCIETTFQQMRSYLGLETTRGRSENTVLRLAPCLFGLYTLVALWYATLPQSHQAQPAIAWAGKVDITFSDAITNVRRWLWLNWVFATPSTAADFQKLRRPFRALILSSLALAA